MKKNNEKCIWKKWTMVAHKGKLFLWTILISKLNFTFMFNLNFKINLKLEFKFIPSSISFKNQFKFYFISVFYFKLTSKALLFCFLFWTFNLSMWPITANTSLVHGLFLDFYECSQPLEVLFTQLKFCLQYMAHLGQSHLVHSHLLSFT